MGFWGSVGSFFSGVGSAISSGIRAVGSAISSGISAVGNALSTFANTVVSPFLKGIASKAVGLLGKFAGIMTGPLGPIFGPIIVDLAIKVIVKIISLLAEENKVVEKDEKPEDIGYRMEEAEKHEEWKKRDEFGSFKEYYAYLKAQIPEEYIDRARIDKQKEFYSLLGMQAEVQAIEEKLGIKIPNSVLVEIGRSAMQLKEVQAFIRAFNTLGYKELNISEYLKGTLPASELERITTAVLDSLKLYFPGKDEGTLGERLNEMRLASKDDLRLISVYHDDLKAIYGSEIEKVRHANELPKETEKAWVEAELEKNDQPPAGDKL